MPTRSTKSGTRSSEMRDSPAKRPSASRKSRRSSSSVREDSESIARRDDSIGVCFRIDRKTIATEVIPQGAEPMDQCVTGLRESHPRNASRSVHANRGRKIDEVWPTLVDEDVEGTQIRMHDARRGKPIHAGQDR